MSALLLLAASLASAYEPPQYNNSQPVRALREAGQGEIAAVNDALSTNVIKENSAAQKGIMDRLAQRAKDASDAAQALLAAGAGPLGELKSLLEGASSRPSCDSRRREQADALARAQDRLRALADSKANLDAAAERIEKPEDRAKAKALLADAARALAQTSSCLAQSADALQALKDQQDAVRSAAFRMNSTEDEVETAARTLGQRAQSAQGTTSDAKSALDALGDDNATKARAFDRVQAAEDDGKAVFNETSILALRSDDFAGRYGQLLSAARRFDEGEKGFKQRLSDCDGPFGDSEQKLAAAKDAIR